MRTIRLLTIAVATASFSLLIAMSPVDFAPAPPLPPHVESYTGAVTGWSIDATGTVSLRLAGNREDGESFALWFTTPANRTSSTQFEELVFGAVLALASKASRPESVTVLCETSNEVTGQSVASALPIASLRYE